MTLDANTFEPDQYDNAAHLDRYGGRPVTDYVPGLGIDPTAHTYRLRLDHDAAHGDAAALADAFLAEPNAADVDALIVGLWPTVYPKGPGPLVERLVSGHRRLPRLRRLFVGDIVCEECELSWIVQGHLGPLLQAFGSLEHFAVRYGTGLTLGKQDLPNLKSLTIQTGGMGAQVVRDVLASNLPKLEKLVLWLGTEDYGGSVTPDDLRPLLHDDILPALRWVGLCNYDGSDELAVESADAPLLGRIDVLDLSMGTLGNAGGRALLASDRIRRLDRLILRHHYVGPTVLAEMDAAAADGTFPRFEHDDDDLEDTGGTDDEDDEWRFVACGE